MQDRRAHPRVGLKMAVRITRKGTLGAGEVMLQDICTHGIGVYSQERFEKGDLLIVGISLPDEEGKQVAELAEGEVVWTEPMQQGSLYALGIRFDRLGKANPRLYKRIQELERKLNLYQNS